MVGGNYAGFVDDRYPLEGFYVRTPKFMRLANWLARIVQDTVEQRTWGFDVPTADGRLNQVASTHLLGQRFAKVFNLRAREDYVHQTSFGIGLSRLVAAVLDHNPQFGGADDRIAHGAGPGHVARPVLDEGAGAAPPA